MENEKLKKFMMRVPYGAYAGVKNEIIRRCCISEWTWKNWLKGRVSIPPLAVPIIKEVMADKSLQKVK